MTDRRTDGYLVCLPKMVLIVLQISRLSEGSTGQIFATSSVIYQMKTWGLLFLKVVDDTSDSEY